MNTITKNTKNFKPMVLLAIFAAIEIIFCFTTLGSLPLGPGIVATLAHIPVIIIAIVLGKKPGMYMGAIMGICSLLVWTFMPPNPLTAFAFSPFASNGSWASLLIVLVPRILFPLFVSIFYTMFINKFSMKSTLSAVFASIIGTFIHSFLVLSLIYLFFNANPVVGKDYLNVIIAWGGINAIMEIVVAGVVTAGLVPALLKIKKI